MRRGWTVCWSPRRDLHTRALRTREGGECADLAGSGAGAVGTQGGTAGLEPGHRHPERRARDVVQAHLVEEVHRVGVAAVLAADAQLQVWPCCAPTLDGDLDE